MKGAPADPGRADYLREVAALFWPEPHEISTGRGQRAGRAADTEFAVVPDLARPRLVVPISSRRAAATAIRRYAEPGSFKARARTAALAGAFATGLGPLLVRDRLRVHTGPAGADSVQSYLRDALGEPVLLSMHVSRPRANRKPVLQLLAPDGRLVAYVKVGTSPLTRALVRAERDNLATVAAARLGSATAPTVLHHGRWHDLDLLALAPLPVWERRVSMREDALVATMREIAAIGGVRAYPLAESGYWAGLVDRVAQAPAAERPMLQSGLDRIGAAAAAPLAFGSWHGDWAPWNLACLADRLLVWDWERFTVGVPVGFDAMHWDLQTRILTPDHDPDEIISERLSRVGELLSPLDVPREQAPLVAALYLVEITTRYALDGQREAGGWSGLVAGLLRAIDAATAALGRDREAA